MKYLSEVIIENKKVFLRCDFNVPVNNNKIIDNSKIVKSFDTIKYLLDKNNEIFLFSHFGRVKEESDKNSNSLKLVYEELLKYFDLDFVEDPTKIEVVTNVSNKKIHLVENTRFTDIGKKRESKNDLELAKYWSSFCDVFVLDAFASMHRVHSSTAGISLYLPTYIGFLAEKEIKNLEKLVNNNEHPYLVIMGGAKPDDKILIMESILKKCDYLITTGGILNTSLKLLNREVGKSLVSDKEEVVSSLGNIIKNYSNKLYMSNRFIVERDNKKLEVEMDNIDKNDIIYDNIIDLENIINDSKVIFWNGTCGKYENELYEEGTKKLLELLKLSNAHVYVGGGDTVSAVYKYGYENDFEYLSSGGGATLEYVASGKLQALEWIKENGVKN